MCLIDFNSARRTDRALAWNIALSPTHSPSFNQVANKPPNARTGSLGLFRWGEGELRLPREGDLFGESVLLRRERFEDGEQIANPVANGVILVQVRGFLGPVSPLHARVSHEFSGELFLRSPHTHTPGSSPAMRTSWSNRPRSTHRPWSRTAVTSDVDGRRFGTAGSATEGGGTPSVLTNTASGWAETNSAHRVTSKVVATPSEVPATRREGSAGSDQRTTSVPRSRTGRPFHSGMSAPTRASPFTTEPAGKTAPGRETSV